MKKILATTLLVILMLVSLAACGKSAPSPSLGIGTAVVQTGNNASASSPAAAETAVTVAAVILADGKIAAAALETYTGKYNVSDRGVYSADSAPVSASLDASAFIGKSAGEISAMTALSAAVKSAVLSAIDSAKADSAPTCKKTDKVGVALVGAASGASADFFIDDGMNGAAKLDATYAAVAAGADGRVSAALIDAVQISRSFDARGKLGEAKTPSTKRELGYGYGMKGVSASFGIGLEWFEQADGFASYVIGKTASEIGSISVSESGKATDAALLSSCTITIFDFISAAKAAAERAN